MKIPENYFRRYLQHLGIEKENPSLNYLNRLIARQIQKFPFENISKLLLYNKEKLTSLIDYETHLTNSIRYGCGGTCYACNYYFNRLLKFAGFNAKIHGANMGEGVDVHLVNIVELNTKRYLVDVGYGAPFYEAIELNNDKKKIQWGELEYHISPSENGTCIEVFKRNDNVHEYIVNHKPREIGHFKKIIRHSIRNEADFMNMLRVIKFFENSSIELSNFKITVHENTESNSFMVNNIDELCEVIKRDFMLPLLPIKEAYNFLIKENRFNP